MLKYVFKTNHVTRLLINQISYMYLNLFWFIKKKKKKQYNEFIITELECSDNCFSFSTVFTDVLVWQPNLWLYKWCVYSHKGPVPFVIIKILPRPSYPQGSIDDNEPAFGFVLFSARSKDKAKVKLMCQHCWDWRVLSRFWKCAFAIASPWTTDNN